MEIVDRDKEACDSEICNAERVHDSAVKEIVVTNIVPESRASLEVHIFHFCISFPLHKQISIAGKFIFV